MTGTFVFAFAIGILVPLFTGWHITNWRWWIIVVPPVMIVSSLEMFLF